MLRLRSSSKRTGLTYRNPLDVLDLVSYSPNSLASSADYEFDTKHRLNFAKEQIASLSLGAQSLPMSSDFDSLKNRRHSLALGTSLGEKGSPLNSSPCSLKGSYFLKYSDLKIQKEIGTGSSGISIAIVFFLVSFFRFSFPALQM